MMRKLLILFLMLGFVFVGGVSCTSSDEEGDGQEIESADTEVEEGDEFADEGDAEFSDEEGDEFADEEGDDSDLDDDFSEDAGSDEFAEGDELEDAEEGEFAATDEGGDFGDGVDEDLSVDNSEQVTDTAAPSEDSAFVDEGGFESVGESADSSDTFASDDTSSFSQDGAGEIGQSTFGDSPSAFADTGVEASAKTWVPVKKIKSVPFNKGGQLLNTVYIVRPGDTISSVSTKIYGQDRTTDILAANPHLNRSFSTGDKLYYNSPNRPTDGNQLLTYYEDIGQSPQTYEAQAGENIREVSKNLLGDASSWKEIWATNPGVQSKGILDAPTSLTYFPEGGAPAQNLAGDITNPADEFPPEPSLPAEPDLPPPSMPEPPEPSLAQNDLPPSDLDGGAVGSIEPPPPPAMEPPPPPPAPMMADDMKAKKKKKRKKSSNSKLPLYGGLALMVAALVALIAIRKKKSKPINMGETQI